MAYRLYRLRYWGVSWRRRRGPLVCLEADVWESFVQRGVRAREGFESFHILYWNFQFAVCWFYCRPPLAAKARGAGMSCSAGRFSEKESGFPRRTQGWFNLKGPRSCLNRQLREWIDEIALSESACALFCMCFYVCAGGWLRGQGSRVVACVQYELQDFGVYPFPISSLGS